ncbi:MAG: NADH-quinone oxidoreductase subunit L [Caldisericia bacterium]
MGDTGIARYYAELQLFTVAMLGVVTASNLLQMFAFWELVGLCSYLLIGFWFAERSVYQAAKKAFFVTKVGDVFLFLGIFAIFAQTQTLDFIKLPGSLSALGPVMLIIIPLCIFAGAMGKSAQFPLHVWLPNAMEGPTPVSALIHAATMVAAGIYLVARTMPIFMLDKSGTALTIVMMIGAITAFMGATIATVQAEIKKVLAFSTISQLGYMVMGLGAVYIGHGEFALIGFVAALFHLMTHAFFKGLLFLGSGSVIHATHTKNMHEMGGLIKKMPVTGWTFVIGSLALAGFPLFAGFWSKDAIIGAVHLSAHNGHTIAWVALGFALAGAFLTPYYMTRCVWLTFFGKPRKENHAHEGSWKSRLPLIILGSLAALVGFVGVPFWGAKSHFFQNFLGNGYAIDSMKNMMVVVKEAAGHATHEAVAHGATSHGTGHHIYESWDVMSKPLLFGSIGLVLLGVLLVYLFMFGNTAKSKTHGSQTILHILQESWFMDEHGHSLLSNHSLVCRILQQFDAVVIDGMVNGTAWLMLQFAKLVNWFDSHTLLMEWSTVSFGLS